MPAALRAELVDELMAARREVGAAGRRGDDAAVAAARARVHDAKVALGERGRPWWEEPDDDGDGERLACAIRALLRHRAAGRTICPSDAARAVGGDRWRTLLPQARDVARVLARAGAIEITQKGQPVPPDAVWKGPVRLRVRVP